MTPSHRTKRGKTIAGSTIADLNNFLRQSKPANQMKVTPPGKSQSSRFNKDNSVRPFRKGPLSQHIVESKEERTSNDSTNAGKKRRRQEPKESNDEEESEINRKIAPCNDTIGAGLSMSKISESQDTIAAPAVCSSDLKQICPCLADTIVKKRKPDRNETKLSNACNASEEESEDSSRNEGVLTSTSLALNQEANSRDFETSTRLLADCYYDKDVEFDAGLSPTRKPTKPSSQEGDSMDVDGTASISNESKPVELKDCHIDDDFHGSKSLQHGIGNIDSCHNDENSVTMHTSPHHAIFTLRKGVAIAAKETNARPQDESGGEVTDCHDENLIDVYRSPQHAVLAPDVDESTAMETNICHDEIPVTVHKSPQHATSSPPPNLDKSIVTEATDACQNDGIPVTAHKSPQHAALTTTLIVDEPIAMEEIAGSIVTLHKSPENAASAPSVDEAAQETDVCNDDKSSASVHQSLQCSASMPTVDEVDAMEETDHFHAYESPVATEPPYIVAFSPTNGTRRRERIAHSIEEISPRRSGRKHKRRGSSVGTAVTNSVTSASTRSVASEFSETTKSSAVRSYCSPFHSKPSLVRKKLTVGVEELRANLKTQDENLFPPKGTNASELLKSRDYILMFLQRILPDRQIPSVIVLEDFITNNVPKKESGLNKSLPSVRQLTRILIEYMGFDCSSEVFVGDDSVPLKPSEEKISIRTSAVKNFIDFRLKFLRVSEDAAPCQFMEEVALAYRLAVHFTLISCSRLVEYHRSNVKQVRSLKKIQNRALLSVLVSLRKIYVELLRNELMDNKTAVSSNMRNFFYSNARGKFSQAEVLWTDCATILTEVDGDIVMLDEDSNILVENMLKLDKEFSNRRDFAFSEGLMELLLRQLIAKELAFVGVHGPIKRKMEKLSMRTRKYTGALACVLDDLSPECAAAIKNVIELRRNDVKSLVSSPVTIMDLTEIEDLAPDEGCILLMEGCMFLAKVFEQYKSVQRIATDYSEKYAQTQTMEQMAFYLFHLLMEKDPHSQKTTDGSVHPFSTSKRLNLKSAALAALMLASKCMDSQIPMRNLLTYSANVSNDHSQQFRKGESGSPYKDLVHLYEIHLMILIGYDAPEISCLPYASVKEVSEMLSLSAAETDKFKRVFGHFGVKFSPSSLIDEPLLIAFAVFHFGCNHLHFLRPPSGFDAVLGDEKRMVEVLSNHMSAIYTLYQSMVGANVSSEPKLRRTTNLMISLSSISDQLNNPHEYYYCI